MMADPIFKTRGWVITRVLFRLLWHFVCHFLNPVCAQCFETVQSIAILLDALDESATNQEKGPVTANLKETKMSVRKEGTEKLKAVKAMDKSWSTGLPAVKRMADREAVVTVNPL
jgi:hypothetical protein